MDALVLRNNSEKILIKITISKYISPFAISSDKGEAFCTNKFSLNDLIFSSSG